MTYLSPPGPGPSDHRSIHDLVVLAQQGDDYARSHLVDRFYPSVQDAVHRRLSYDLRRTRPWLASLLSTGDVVQEVFYGVLRDLDSFEGDSEDDFVRFVSATVTHRLIDTIRFHESKRRDGRRTGRDVDVAQIGTGDPNGTVERVVSREETAVVQEALAGLGSRDRALLELRFRLRSTYPQIGAALGMEADAARKAVRTAEARLLFVLQQRGITS